MKKLIQGGIAAGVLVSLIGCGPSKVDLARARCFETRDGNSPECLEYQVLAQREAALEAAVLAGTFARPASPQAVRIVP